MKKNLRRVLALLMALAIVITSIISMLPYMYGG